MPQNWENIEPGLEMASFPAPGIVRPATAASIRVLRIDPSRFEFRLLNASRKKGGKPLSARQWSRRHELVAAINASMYQRDHMTSVSYMKSGKHVNNTWFSKDKALLAFDPQSPALPPVQILDRDCQDVKQLRKQYQSLVQSIRMVSCDRKNVWEQQKRKKWSVAAIGEDLQGRILFIHSRVPTSVHDLIEHLLKLKTIQLKRAMYVEGGPEAQLFVNAGESKQEFVGTFKNSRPESTGNTIAWPIPNVIGVVRKPVK
ncbi:MAG: phosphodiester glycosidase family protein [Candidatus Nitronauta litoralis]|uniref:Phosphodiester glycosidase family protein n=1 Tax=Candidatus Nitronauta litoralis TaxID=2705533 RepID=A0A7T0BWI0_9BACT|nr:MAG: phosphodiester glycosidase family protein [Candidatus Nitronauta litoralis]